MKGILCFLFAVLTSVSAQAENTRVHKFEPWVLACGVNLNYHVQAQTEQPQVGLFQEYLNTFYSDMGKRLVDCKVISPKNFVLAFEQGWMNVIMLPQTKKSSPIRIDQFLLVGTPNKMAQKAREDSKKAYEAMLVSPVTSAKK